MIVFPWTTSIFFVIAYEQPPEDKCNPSPCGANTKCDDGVCSCLSEFSGNPYIACRPECVLNTDCPMDKACVRNKCVNPCIGTCGQNAICTVFNHIPMCSCTPNTSGNAFVICLPIKGRYLPTFLYWSRRL